MIKINKVTKKIDVYDIQVDNTNNFYANNVLVHNCEIFQASKFRSPIQNFSGRNQAF